MAKVRPGFERVKCGKCSGTGYVRGFEHYADGVCFDCKGAGSHEVSLATIAANRKPRAEVIRTIKLILDRVKNLAKEGDEYGDDFFHMHNDDYEMGWILAHADADVYERAIAAIKRLPMRQSTIKHSLHFIERIRVAEEAVLKSGRRRTYGRRDPQRARRKIPAGSLKARRRAR